MEKQNHGRRGFPLVRLKEKGFQDLLVQFVKFGIVGVSNTLISLAVYYLCFNVLHMHYQLANLLGFLISVTNAYYWNSRYVFKMGERRAFREHLKTYLRTVTAYGGTYLLSVPLLWLWVDVLGIPENAAPLLNLCVTIPLNFLINKFWTFRKKPAEAADGGTAGQTPAEQD